MANLSITNTLVTGATVTASDHNTNYSDIVNYVNNRNSGAATWDACSISGSAVVPLVVNNGTGLNDIARFQDNGSDVFVVYDGGIVTAAMQSAARAFRNTSTQTFTDNVQAKVQFNGESYDIQSEFDSTTNFRFTATKSGKYLVSSSVNFTLGASQTDCTIFLFKNGSEIARKPIGGIVANTIMSIGITDVVSLVATDYLEIFCTFNSIGTNTTVNSDSDRTYFCISKIA